VYMKWSISAVSEFGMRVEWCVCVCARARVRACVYLHCSIPRNCTRARTHAKSTCVQEAQAKERSTKEHSFCCLHESYSYQEQSASA